MERNTKDSELETKVLNLLNEKKILMDPGFVAEHLKISWQKARTLLLEMTISNQIVAVETTKGYFYQPKNN